MKHLLFLFFFILMVQTSRAQSTFINEINYLSSNPTAKGVEIAGAAGVNLEGWKVITYNLVGGEVSTLIISAGNVIPNQQNGYGAIWVDVDQNTNGGGVALFNPAGVIQQLLSYGITNPGLPDVGGLAAQFIGTQFSSTDYIRLTGTGTTYPDFSWSSAENSGHTRGAVNTGQSFAPLPVELVAFTGAISSSGALLNWKTASELNNAWFEIERSEDGTFFQLIQQLPGRGTVNSETSYQYLDKQPLEGLNYYRLRQIDLDGSYTFSRTIALTFEPGAHWAVTVMNPVTNQLFVWVDNNEKSSIGKVEIYNLAGKLLLSNKLEQNAHFFEINVSHLIPNEYLLLVSNGPNVHIERILKH